MCQGPRSRVIMYKHTQRNWVWESVGVCGTTWQTLTHNIICYPHCLSLIPASVTLLIHFLFFSCLPQLCYSLQIILTQKNIKKTCKWYKILKCSLCHSMHDKPKKIFSYNITVYSRKIAEERKTLWVALCIGKCLAIRYGTIHITIQGSRYDILR